MYNLTLERRYNVSDAAEIILETKRKVFLVHSTKCGTFYLVLHGTVDMAYLCAIQVVRNLRAYTENDARFYIVHRVRIL